MGKNNIDEEITFNENEVFEGLAHIFNFLNRNVTTMVSDNLVPVCDVLIDGFDDEYWAIRTYTIYDDDYELVKWSNIIPGGKVGYKGKDMRISLDKLSSLLKPLYIEVPHLGNVYNAFLVDVFVNGFDSVTDKMINAAINVVDKREGYDRAAVYQKLRKDSQE